MQQRETVHLVANVFGDKEDGPEASAQRITQFVRQPFDGFLADARELLSQDLLRLRYGSLVLVVDVVVDAADADHAEGSRRRRGTARAGWDNLINSSPTTI